LRAPGSWHPKRNNFAQIVASDCEQLLNFLSGNSLPAFSESFPKEKQKIVYLLHPSEGAAASAGEWMVEALARFSITRGGQRHKQLEGLTGYLFHQVGFAVAQAFAVDQYRSKSAETNATESEHLNEFRHLWGGMVQLWLTELSDRERAAFDVLETENERDAYRIIRSYARKAAADGHVDFPIVRDNLCLRLGVTPQGAGKMRVKFCKPEIAILTPTAPYEANVRSARYRWLLSAKTMEFDEPF
jgi:hypothetical protein